MATVAKLNVQIGAELGGLQKSLKNASASLQSFGKKASEIGQSMSTRLTLPIVGGFAFAVKAASDAEETFSKFATVFRDVGSEAEASFQTLRKEYGLSATASKALLSGTGDLLTGFGFAQSESLRLSTEVQKLAVDLASFTNFAGGAEGASSALTKALLGERESVKALGISILEEDVKKQMAINTAKGLTFATERQAKAQATLDIAMAQSQNAIGDYARTSGSFANQFRLLQSNVSDLATEFGTILLPVAQKILSFTKKLVDGFKGLDTEAKKQVLLFGAIAAAIGPLVFAFGLLAKAVAFVITPIFLKIAAIVALGVGINTLIQNLKPLGERFMYYFGIAKNAVIEMAATALNALGELVSYANATAGGALKVLAESMRSLKDEIEDPANMTPFVGSLEALGDTFSILKDKVLGYVDSLSKASTEIETLSKKSKDVTAPTFAFSGGGIESADMRTEGELKVRTVDTETYANVVGYLGSKLKKVAVDTSAINMQTEQMSVGFELLKPLSDEFVNSFAQGMANVVMQGEKLQDVLKNIGKLLLSSAIQFAISALLTGGVGAGTGFFGKGGGIFGSLFGGATPVNDALIQSNGNIVKFHPDDNILAMKDFNNLGGGGTVSAIRVSVDTIRVSGSDILIALKNAERAYG